MHTKMKISNYRLYVNCLKNSLNLLDDLSITIFGVMLIHCFFWSSHSFCFSVSRKFFPRISFSRLNVETTTPTKRLSTRKLPSTTKSMKNRLQYTFSLICGSKSTPTESIPRFITSSQPSVVDIWNKVNIACKTLSKLWSALTQAPPKFKQSYLDRRTKLSSIYKLA